MASSGSSFLGTWVMGAGYMVGALLWLTLNPHIEQALTLRIRRSGEGFCNGRA